MAADCVTAVLHYGRNFHVWSKHYGAIFVCQISEKQIKTLKGAIWIALVGLFVDVLIKSSILSPENGP